MLYVVGVAPNDPGGLEALRLRVMRERNVVVEMVATLRAVKPIREPRRELIVPPALIFLPA